MYMYIRAFTILLIMCFGLYQDYFVGYCFLYVLQSDYNKVKSLCVGREMWREVIDISKAGADGKANVDANAAVLLFKQRQSFEQRDLSYSCVYLVSVLL